MIQAGCVILKSAGGPSSWKLRVEVEIAVDCGYSRLASGKVTDGKVEGVETDFNTSNCTNSAECVCLLSMHKHEPLTEDFSILWVQFLVGILDVFCAGYK